MDGNYKEWLYMKRGIFCFPLFSIAESWLYTSNRMIFAAQATVAFLQEDLGAEWWKLQRGLGNCCGDVRWWACLKEDMLYASGMLCPHNATHLKKVWKSCQTLHATVVDVYKIDKIVNRIQVSFQSEVKDLPKLLGTWLMDRCSEVFELNIELISTMITDERW